jgi:hypothetical protein
MNERFTTKDIDEDIQRIMLQAQLEGLISPTQVFLLGMDQGASKDWEDYEELVDYIENLLPSEWPKDHISSTQTHKATRAAIECWKRNEWEAKESRVNEVDVP